MIFNITSSKNEKFKYFKSLLQKKYRTDEYMVEGKKSVQEAIFSGREVTALILSEGTDFTIPEEIPAYIMPDFLVEKLSQAESSSGVICTIRIEKNEGFLPDTEKPYIYCDRISDPGNLGTIIRTADAAGFGGVMLSPGTVDLYNPKTVRSSMGSFFKIQVIENVSYDKLADYRDMGFSVYSGALSENTIDYTEPDYKRPAIIVIGNESNGVSDEVIRNSDKCIKIPIIGGAESLNAAVAAGIIMYEAVRQRKS